VSKAFTREDGNDAPAVPRRRAPLPAGLPNYVTARGLQALRDELAALDPVAASGASGAAQPAPRSDLQALAARRAELEQRITTAVPAPPPADHDEIRFGARVRVRAPDGRPREVQIVGVDEADPAAGLIAFVAPLARALLGRRIGDQVTVRTPGGEEELEVLAVGYEAPA
jgi:transcription elongation factor GreB